MTESGSLVGSLDTTFGDLGDLMALAPRRWLVVAATTGRQADL